MIAAISLMRRRQDIPLALFRRHWLDVHGPLVCRFSGLARYVQCHVLACPAMNQAAQDMGIDGFPILFFNHDTDRIQAQESQDMALCNEDSRHFVGAVSRVTADAEVIVPPLVSHGAISLIILWPGGQDADIAALRDLPRLRGLVQYHVRQQGAAPSSTIPHLPVTIRGAAQVWFDSVVDLEEALISWHAAEAAVFVVEEHWLLPGR